MFGKIRKVHIPDERPRTSLPLRVARFLDDLPIAPHALAEVHVKGQMDHQDRRAAEASPRWRELHDRGSYTLEEMFEMFDIEREVSPTPAYLKAVRSLQHITAYRIVRSLKGAKDRVRRGWSDSDTWNLGDTNARFIGEQLLYLADIAAGWPSNEEFPEYEDWTAALREHGTILATKTHDNGTEYKAALDRWSKLHRGQGKQSPEAEEAWRELHDIEAADHAAIKASLHWFAEHYEQLWD